MEASIATSSKKNKDFYQWGILIITEPETPSSSNGASHGVNDDKKEDKGKGKHN